MLVLSRKLNESIVIGNVVVKVVHIDKTRVRLGIVAPEDVSVRRAELIDTSGTKPLGETEVGKEATRNATQASDDAGQEDD